MKARGAEVIGLVDVEEAVQRKAIVYDRQGDAHFDVISAFIKSIRGSDPDAALFWLARMIEAGEDARYIARRMVVHASEDIGLADPRALLVAVAAAQAVEYVGLPEARLNLAEAAIYLSRAPKSNTVIAALGKASEDAASATRCPSPSRGELPGGPHSATARGTGTRTTSTGTGWSRSIARSVRGASLLPAERTGRGDHEMEPGTGPPDDGPRSEGGEPGPRTAADGLRGRG